jgi:hypothetical protein
LKETHEKTSDSIKRNQQISRRSLQTVSQHLTAATWTQGIFASANQAITADGADDLSSSEVYSTAYTVASYVDLGLSDPYERYRARELGHHDVKSRGHAQEENTAWFASVSRVGRDADVQVMDAAQSDDGLYIIHPVVDGRSKNASPPPAA